MTRSHYLMTKITNRFDKEGNPIISDRYHGTQYKYLESPQKSMEIPEEDDDLERSHDSKHESDIPVVEVGPPSPVKQEEPLSSKKWSTIDQVITLLQNQPDDTGQFFYMLPGDPQDPYDLTPLIEIKPDDLKLADIPKKFTISKKGITTYENDVPVDYITLNDWIHDREHYRRIRKLDFFAQFRRWKIIRMWRKNILRNNRKQVEKTLKKKLFILDEDLSGVLMNHKGICPKMVSELKFVHMGNSHERMTLSNFQENQTKIRTSVEKRVGEYSRESREKFKAGIDAILSKLREETNDDND